jgi:hypothetical protein
VKFYVDGETLMVIETLSITERDLLKHIWHEFKQYNSEIGYVSCGVVMNNHDYTITTFSDGSMESIIEDAEYAGEPKEDLEVPGQRYHAVPARGGRLLIKIVWNAAEPICYCDRTKLAELWNGLSHLKGQSPVAIQWIEDIDF